MATETTKIVGATLEILAPLVPYGTEVKVLDGEEQKGLNGKMAQLYAVLALYSPKVCVLFKHDESLGYLRETEEEAGNIWPHRLPVQRVLPVLYGFDALPHVMVEAPWGSTPASVVLARMIAGMQFMPENVRAQNTSIWAQDYDTGPFKCVLHADTVRRGNLLLPVVEWLRSNHFAVGLEPGQFIPKTSSAAPIDKNTAL